MKEISTLEDIAGVINKDDNGLIEIYMFICSLDRDKLDVLALHMAVLVAITHKDLEDKKNKGE